MYVRKTIFKCVCEFGSGREGILRGLESRDSVSLRKKTVRSWSSNVIVQTVLTALLRWLS